MNRFIPLAMLLDERQIDFRYAQSRCEVGIRVSTMGCNPCAVKSAFSPPRAPRGGHDFLLALDASLAMRMLSRNNDIQLAFAICI